jgi:hypothetical protein
MKAAIAALLALLLGFAGGVYIGFYRLGRTNILTGWKVQGELERASIAYSSADPKAAQTELRRVAAALEQILATEPEVGDSLSLHASLALTYGRQAILARRGGDEGTAVMLFEKGVRHLNSRGGQFKEADLLAYVARFDRSALRPGAAGY